MRNFWNKLVFASLLVTSAAYAVAEEMPAPKKWAVLQEPRYGAIFYYPSNWFGAPKAKAGGYEFATLNGDGATLYLKVEFDELRTGAEATVEKLKSGKGAHRITAIEMGDMYYQMRLLPTPDTTQVTEVRYSCNERIVSAFTLIYPTTQAKPYEAMFAKIKRRFSMGIGAETPVRQCS